MKILTWNAQGYGGSAEKSTIIHKILNTGEYDILCIQECGTPLASFNLRYGFNNVEICNVTPPINGRSKNHICDYTALYYQWGDANYRCSLVTYIKTSVWECNNVWIVPDGANRPMLCSRLTNNIVIGNIHLCSGNENYAFLQLLIFQQALVNERYCILGDFNINATDHPNEINMLNGYYHIGHSTQISGGCLDYLYSPNLVPSFFSKVVLVR